MRTIRLYIQSALLPHSRLTLQDDKHHYISRVLRLRVGDQLTIFNGDGFNYLSTIVSIERKTSELSIGEKEPGLKESPIGIHLHQALVKSDKLDWIIQKTIELGIKSVHFFSSSRTELKLEGSRLQNKILHWQGIIEQALMQSGRSHGVTMSSPSPLEESLIEPGCHIAFHPKAIDNWDGIDAHTNYHLWIGPEGGFSDTEISYLQSNNVKILPLGPRILRAETAAVAATTLLQAKFGDLLT